MENKTGHTQKSIEDIRYMKIDLCYKISTLITDFKDETGLRVHNIDIQSKIQKGELCTPDKEVLIANCKLDF